MENGSPRTSNSLSCHVTRGPQTRRNGGRLPQMPEGGAQGAAERSEARSLTVA